MALKAKSIASSPQMLVYILIPLLIIYIFNFTLSSFVGKFFLSREDAIALVVAIAYIIQFFLIQGGQ